jgi:pimeloyl-ACP methyl ester carboxylesterase
MERVFSDSSTVDMDDVEQIRQEHSCNNTEMDSSERGKVMRGAQDYIGRSIDWQSITVPTLALYGENEPFVERHAKYVRERVEECRIEEIPDASHNSHVDNIEFIMEHTREFLDGVSGERKPAATE